MPVFIRRNGLQLPLSIAQTSIVVLYLLIVAIFQYVVLMNPLERTSQQQWSGLYITFIDACLGVLCVVLWVAIEYIDPGVSISGISGQSRFCHICNKRVAGLDHHCIWLNTCVGERNIRIFLALVGVLVLQLGLQITVCGKMLAEEDMYHSFIAGYFLMLVHQMIGGVIWCGLAVLGLFHVYLIVWVRKTTYEWLLTRRGWRHSVDDAHSTGHHSGFEFSLSRMESGEFALPAPQDRNQEAWEEFLAQRQQDQHHVRAQQQVNAFNSDYLSYQSHSNHSVHQVPSNGNSFQRLNKVVPVTPIRESVAVVGNGNINNGIHGANPSLYSMNSTPSAHMLNSAYSAASRGSATSHKISKCNSGITGGKGSEYMSFNNTHRIGSGKKRAPSIAGSSNTDISGHILVSERDHFRSPSHFNTSSAKGASSDEGTVTPI